MSSFGALSRLAAYGARSRYAIGSLAAQQHRQWRGIATKQVNEKLPLAGIRVLDMTRVLAGVGHCYIQSSIDLQLTCDSLHVHKFWAILGKSRSLRKTRRRLIIIQVQR